MSRANGAAAAFFALMALAVQVAAALGMGLVNQMLGLALMLLCFLINAFAAYKLRSWIALAAAVVSGIVAVALPYGTNPAWIGNIGVNLLFLLFYLPFERDIDRILRTREVSDQTLGLGRTWALATLIQRGASMLGFLPIFEGQAEQSIQKGSYTVLFSLQAAFEVIALIAAVFSYVWMVRYLWRVKTLLKGE